MRICNALCEFGYEVTLVGRVQKKSIALNTESFKQYRLKCYFNKGILFYLEFNFRLLMYLLKQPKCIIGSVDNDTLTACALAKKIKKMPLIFDSHEYFTEVPELSGHIFKQKIWLLVEKLFIKNCNLSYTVSKSIADVYTAKYHVPFYTIFNCPNQLQTIHQDNFHSKIIIYQGALNLGRGLEELIEAMELIDAVLWLVGEGDKSDQLRALSQSKAWSNRIIFYGFVEPSKLNFLTSQATIGYNVLRNLGLSYQYSLSNKFFDYIQNRIPSLSSTFVEYTKILEMDKVGLTCNCDKLDIVSKINNMLTDKKLYQEMVAACEIASQKYTWEREKQKIKELYEKL